MKSFDFPNLFKYVVGYLDLSIGKTEDSQLRQRKTEKLKTNSSSNQSVNIINCKNKLGIISKGVIFNSTCDSNTFKIKKAVAFQSDKSHIQETLRHDKLSKTKISGFSVNTFRTIKDLIKQEEDKQNISNQDKLYSTQTNKQSIFKIQKGKNNSKNKITIRKLASKQQFKTNSKLDSQNDRKNMKRTSITKRMPNRFMTQMLDDQNENSDYKKNFKQKENKQKKTKVIKFNVKTTQNQSDFIISQKTDFIGLQKTIRSSKTGTKKTFKSLKQPETPQKTQQQLKQDQKNSENTFQKKLMKFSKTNVSLNNFKRNKKNIYHYTSLQFILDPQQEDKKQINFKQRFWKSQPLLCADDKDNELLLWIKENKKNSKLTTKPVRGQSNPNMKKVIFKQGSENQGKVFKGIKRIKKDKNSNDQDFSTQIHDSQFYISSKKQLKSSVKKITNSEIQYGNVFLELNNFQKFMELQTMEQIECDQSSKITQFAMYSQAKKKNQDQQIKDFKIKKFQQQKMLQMSKMFTKRANQLKQNDMRCLAYVSY